MWSRIIANAASTGIGKDAAECDPTSRFRPYSAHRVEGHTRSPQLTLIASSPTVALILYKSWVHVAILPRWDDDNMKTLSVLKIMMANVRVGHCTFSRLIDDTLHWHTSQVTHLLNSGSSH